MDLGCPSSQLSTFDSYSFQAERANAAFTAAVSSNHHCHGSVGEARCVRDHCSCVMDDNFGILVDPNSVAIGSCCSLGFAGMAYRCCMDPFTVADDGVASGCTCFATDVEDACH